MPRDDFVRVLIPQTGRVELLHRQTVAAHGLTPLEDAAELPELPELPDPDDDPGEAQTSEPVMGSSEPESERPFGHRPRRKE